MFDTIDGLPVHPLVVHAVVVLLPLAVLGTVAVVLKPSWRLRYGWLLVACTAVATALVPVATSSGEAFEKHVGDPGRHAELGDQLIWFAVPLLVLVVALVLVSRSRSLSKVVTTGVAMLALIAAVGTAVQVYRVGESGARAAWAGAVQS
ncbi:DUF2231 domain-containing protein [Nocardioides sp. Kera G14]|uniref:DUF2231 domain-containing protein n=1 Tax=Nocardioides sp. Kera G14 TaxID=2884264 RepID=UPI001D10FF5D|nr:DUF2231 domain-containing protein [Nocardioides sp. Kera G14]UDY23830.1 hypothetical protein LH076_00600 [Nocardioides sp. Kera G14]